MSGFENSQSVAQKVIGQTYIRLAEHAWPTGVIGYCDGCGFQREIPIGEVAHMLENGIKRCRTCKKRIGLRAK